jgi:hypothetical protein
MDKTIRLCKGKAGREARWIPDAILAMPGICFQGETDAPLNEIRTIRGKSRAFPGRSMSPRPLDIKVESSHACF